MSLTPEPAARRLAAILAADIAGYTRLMAQDESGTHAALKRLLQQFVAPALAAHSGRIVKTTGDGFLAEFTSVVEAAQAAVEIQRAVHDAGQPIPAERRLVFRMGVNIGDVIVDDGDLFGDGVNVAARLE
jgi:class 3 adenylate cyclase